MDRLPDLSQLLPVLRDYLPLLATLAIAALVLVVTHTLMRLRERRLGRGRSVGRQLAMLVLTSVGAVAIVLALPVSEALTGRLLGLLGLALTAVVAFSSTTFVANAMAGLMLRAVENFRPGDWLKVGDQFGRVTERGIFHTEIQTEERDLATLPNLYLVTNPVKVVHASGTIVTTTLSLGYDLEHTRIEELLAEAATAAGLEEPFVHIVELGDFAVTYRVAGFLPEVKHLLSVRSRLRGSILDTLHGAGVEIVSPTFMNQRRLGEDAHFVPAERPAPAAAPEAPLPEERIFDKAEEKASLEELREERRTLQAELEELEGARAGAGEGEKAALEETIALRSARIAAIDDLLQRDQAG